MRFDPNAMDGRWVLLGESEPLTEETRWYELRDGQVWTAPYPEPVGSYEFDAVSVRWSIELPPTEDSPAYAFSVMGVGLVGSTGEHAAISSMTAALSATLNDEFDSLPSALIREGPLSDVMLNTNVEATAITSRISRHTAAGIIDAAAA